MNICPACYRIVGKTLHGNIAGHFDTIGAKCPGSYQPYHITIEGRPACVTAA